MSTVLVTGGTGGLGSQVVTRLLQRHHNVRILSSRPSSPQSQGVRVSGDMASRTGLHEAVAGVDAIIHCASSFKDTQGIDVEGTRALVNEAKESGWPHFVYISIVGVDQSDFFYYQKKYEAEQIVQQSPLPWSILRATQYHSFAQFIIQSFLANSETEVKVPAGVRLQLVDSGEVADRLVAIAELGPLNHIVEFGGPQVLTIEEMTQAYLQSHGRKAVVRAEPFSDPMFSALSSDSILTPDHATGLMTWKEFLDRSRTGSRQEEPMAVEENKKNDEAAIQRLLDDGIKSLRDKNIEGIMSLYAQEVVTFDIVPPPRYLGADALRKRWVEAFFAY